MEILVALIGVAGSVLSVYLTAKFKDQVWSESYSPKILEPGENKNTILLVGVGRVGKTQLVEHLTSSEPGVKNLTNNFSIKSCEKRYPDKNITYYISDYRGQNFGQLINSFIKEQLIPKTVLRYGDINTLIMMVDLFPADDVDTSQNVQSKDVNMERINYHLRIWNEFALDAVFALLEKSSLQYVCLFINKADKLANGFTHENEKKIIKHFEPLISTMKDRSSRSNAFFEVIVGSAYRGHRIGGVDGLESRINKYSVPQTPIPYDSDPFKAILKKFKNSFS